MLQDVISICKRAKTLYSYDVFASRAQQKIVKSTSKIDFQKYLMILAPFFPAAPDPQKRENTARLGGRRQAHAPG